MGRGKPRSKVLIAWQTSQEEPISHPGYFGRQLTDWSDVPWQKNFSWIRNLEGRLKLKLDKFFFVSASTKASNRAMAGLGLAGLDNSVLTGLIRLLIRAYCSQEVRRMYSHAQRFFNNKSQCEVSVIICMVFIKISVIAFQRQTFY